MLFKIGQHLWLKTIPMHISLQPCYNDIEHEFDIITRFYGGEGNSRWKKAALPEVPEDLEREHRITMEIIVDAYGPRGRVRPS